MSELIFEKSRGGRRAFAQAPVEAGSLSIPEKFLRDDKPRLPEASELQTVRHYTRLSQKNFSIDTAIKPSVIPTTMKRVDSSAVHSAKTVAKITATKVPPSE